MDTQSWPASLRHELSFGGDVAPGNTGRSVKIVQEWLTFHGFATAIDADFGSATMESVRRFQKKAKLTVSGNVDAKTWDRLCQPLRDAVADGNGTTLGVRLPSVARQHLAQSPRELGGENRGPWVRAYVGGSDGPEWRWCAGFVSFVLRQACVELGLKLPISGSVSCDTLAAQAREANRFMPGRHFVNGTVPWKNLGSCFLFLVRRTDSDWTHVGFGFGGSPDAFQTIEGNTNDSGTAEGYEVCARTRSAKLKDFIRLL
jgi:hypothetical protein